VLERPQGDDSHDHHQSPATVGLTRIRKAMKPPLKRLAALKPSVPAGAYARPTPKVSRQRKAKVLTDAERAAFLALRPDLASKA
jgi:hypothetical protein